MVIFEDLLEPLVTDLKDAELFSVLADAATDATTRDLEALNDGHHQQESTRGANAGFFRRDPYNLQEGRVEETKPVEEPIRKKKLGQESVRAYGDKSVSPKAKHIKSARKARVNKFYKKGELLGQGGYGSVYAGTRISDGLSLGTESPMPKEVGLYQMVNTPSGHPNILKLFDWFDRPASYIMAMERPNPCKDLFTYCQEQGGVLDEDQTCSVTRELLGALKHCHDHGVVHRDVKPENILIQTDTKEIKLIDFGCGDPLKDTAYTDFSGIGEYLPVEWFQKEEFLAGPGTVWSVGVTAYNMACGDDPFTTYTSKGMRHVDFSAGLSPGIKDFMSCCLRPRPKDRPTLEQLLLHPWLQQAC